MDLFGVIGRPILHSLSPALHNAAWDALGLDARYVRIASRDANEALRTARAIGVRGLNVTSPFKQAAARLADTRDSIAEKLGVANTLLWSAGAWRAHNTDVAGVRCALARHDIQLEGSSALVLGAGGAALAAAAALVEMGAEVTVAARALTRARSVAALAECAACPLREAGPIARGARVIVGAVSTDERVLNRGALQPGAVVLDARYQSESALVRDARASGCTVVDGKEWLLGQAAEAFRIFAGREAPVAAMRDALDAPRVKRGAKLSIVGFPGVGKSSVAQVLGLQRDLPVLDTDTLVEQRAGVPVPQLLREHGEPTLRALEREVLDALPGSPGILSCGGGLLTGPDAARLLRDRSRLIVWLWASPETCLQRMGDPSDRPLLMPTPEIQAPRLLQERMARYAAACDVVVDSEGASANDVAAMIDELWSECA